MLLILHCCPLVFASIALIKSLILHLFWLFLPQLSYTTSARYPLNKQYNKQVCLLLACINSEKFADEKWLIICQFVFVRNSKWLISYSSHTLLSFTPHSLSHTFTLIFTVAHHTLCLDTSLYTNCQWIHSDTYSAKTPQTACYCSHLPILHHPAFTSLPPPAPLSISSLLRLFLFCFPSLKNPTEYTLDHASSHFFLAQMRGHCMGL